MKKFLVVLVIVMFAAVGLASTFRLTDRVSYKLPKAYFFMGLIQNATNSNLNNIYVRLNLYSATGAIVIQQYEKLKTQSLRPGDETAFIFMATPVVFDRWDINVIGDKTYIEPYQGIQVIDGPYISDNNYEHKRSYTGTIANYGYTATTDITALAAFFNADNKLVWISASTPDYPSLPPGYQSSYELDVPLGLGSVKYVIWFEPITNP